MAMNPRLLRPTPTGFDPRRIAGLVGWYDAADQSTLFDATTGGSLVAADGQVGRWEDKSGSSNHLTQGTGNNRPVLKVAIKNGRSILRFSGSTAFLDFTVSTGYTGAVSLFAVFQETSLRFIAVGGAASSSFFGSSYVAANALLWRNDSDAGLTVADTDPSRFVLLTGIRSGTGTNQSRIWRDGGVIDSTGTISGTFQAGSVGRRFTNNNQFSNGDFAELLIYNRALTDNEKTAIELALNRKWAIY